MVFFRHLAALLVKMGHTKRRQVHLCGCNCGNNPIPWEMVIELLVVPLAFVLLFTYIKSTFSTEDIPRGWAVGGGNGVEGGNQQFSLYGEYITRNDGSCCDTCNCDELRNNLVVGNWWDAPFCTMWRRWTAIDPNNVGSSCAPILMIGSRVVGLSADDPNDTPKVRAFVDFVNQNWCDTFGLYTRVYDSSAAMNQYMESADYHRQGRPGLVVAIQFHSIQDQAQPGAWDYSIRFNSTSNAQDGCDSPYYPMYNANEGMDPYVDKLQASYLDQWHEQKFWQHGQYKFQLLIDRYIINTRSNSIPGWSYNQYDTCTKFANYSQNGDSSMDRNCERYYAPQNVYTAPMPIRGYSKDAFFAAVVTMFPLVYCMSFMYTLFNVIVGMTREKELRIKESIAIMGISPAAYTSSWYVFYTGYYMVGAALTTIVGVAGMGGSMTGMFEHCDGFLVWLLFSMFGVNCISYAYLVSAIFSRAKLAGFVGILLFFMAGFGRSGLSTASASALTGCMVLPQIAFFTGIEMLFKYEETGMGVTWSNMYEQHPLTPDTGSPMHSFGKSLLWLFIDPIIYTCVGWYLHKVVPRQWGVAEPFYFLFMPEYWGLSGWGESRAAPERRMTRSHSIMALKAQALSGMVEEVGEALKSQEAAGRTVSLRGLTKTFRTPDGTKVAVDHVDMTMYEGQVYALLGHNGAGKTTLLNIISGMLSMTSGSATILGKDLSTQLTDIRREMGVCPQHNILFPYLTVKEHLLFFGKVKGVPVKEVEAEVTGLIADVGLTEKTHILSKNLSGGMKRKLHVAISLVGGSKVVFLDEPTSGMDPYSRRFTWDLLRRKREGRIMVLTTHFMDEADQLGDRVCIMGDGQVMTCGSSLFLKNKFGQGYNLTITKLESCDTDRLSAHVTGTIEGSNVLSNVGAEISFQLPTDKSHMFPQLLTTLEDDKDGWGVRGYGISITTMEEIFLRVAKGHNLLKNDEAAGKRNSSFIADEPKQAHSDDKDVPTGSTFGGSVFAILQKRFRYGRRDNRAVLCSTFLPILLLFVGLSIMKWGSVVNSGGEYKLKVDQFNEGLPLRMPYGRSAHVPDADVIMSNAATSLAPSASSINTADSSGTFWGARYLNGTVCSSTTSCDRTKFNDDQRSYGPEWAQTGYSTNNSAPDVLAFGKSTCNGWGGDTYWGAPIFNEADLSSSRFEYVLFFNQSASHSGPIFMTAVNNALAGMLQAGTTIAASVWPFPLTQNEKQFNDSISAFWLVMFITIGIAFLPAGMAEFVVKEREATHNSKHLQMLSGCGIVPYWLGTLCWDLINTVPFILFTIIMVYSFEVKTLYEDHAMGVLLSVLVMYGLCAPVFTYSFTFGFMSASSAQIFIVFLFFMAGFILTLVSFFMNLSEQGKCVDQTWFSIENLNCDNFKTMRDLDTSNPACVNLVSLAAIPAMPSILSGLGVNVTAVISTAACADINSLFPAALASALQDSSSTEFCVNAASGLEINRESWQQEQVARLNSECEVTCARCSKPTLSKNLKHAWRLFPPFCVGDAIFNLIMQSLYFKANAIDGVRTNSQYRAHIWKYDQCGGDVVMLAVMSVFYFGLTVVIDVLVSVPRVRQMCGRGGKAPAPAGAGALDEDVAQEQSDMVSRTDDAVRVMELSKVYGRKVAVRGLQFGIPKGGCFGLLGINGAGKTSTLKCMTGDVIPTGGTAVLAGFDVVSQMLDVRKVVGYCPQFDGLHALMTVREHLELYARLKGIPSRQREDVIVSKMAQLDLSQFEHRLAGTLSGGNKRKLSVAIAIIGNPPILFLDEPSSGMDPVARRFMWDVIANISTRSHESTVILTTHAMEECEALCNTVGIMVGGQFKCLGSIQHLKNRFGQGFTVEIRVNDPNDDMVASAPAGSSSNEFFGTESVPDDSESAKARERSGSVPLTGAPSDSKPSAADVTGVVELFKTHFTGSEVVEQNPDNVVFSIPQQDQSVAGIFQVIEENKERLQIREYSVNQTSLEQIFNSFASTQKEEGARAPGLVSVQNMEMGELQPNEK